MQIHSLTSEKDILKYAEHLQKKKSVILDLISGSEESLFLRYKDSWIGCYTVYSCGVRGRCHSIYYDWRRG